MECVTGGNLADYLRARRAQLQPEDVGLPGGTRRRVAGLRREEVAMLAGISPEYYLRLEQGRELRPSDQVLGALAKALRLDADGTDYLQTIGRPARLPVKRPRAEKVSPHVQALIDGWPATAAYVHGSGFRIVAANRLAAAITPHFAVGASPLRAAFLSPDMRLLYRNWDEMTAKTVSSLRLAIAGREGDPEIGELTTGSERFRSLWAKHDVKVRDDGVTQLLHPLVGPLDLRFQKFILPESGQLLVTYHVDPGSPSEGAFRLLAELARGDALGSA
jgi:transcriptional regulator with XRE-family HTH domain